jgi:WS/DGAT/MGAT family acyltransferase
MEQLSGSDSYWLYTERGNVYNHVAALGIYDPSTAPGGKVRFKDLLRYFGGQVEQHRIFRRRLVAVPHGFDRPYWIDDPDLDLEFHIRHVALPQPGDWRQLMIQVARIHSRPLDRSRPLWEIYVIEGLDRIAGLPPGSFALFLKFHHAAVDGEAAAELLRAVHAPTADVDASHHRHATLYAERDPTTVELYSRAVAHGLGRAAGISSLYAKTLTRFVGITVDQVVRKLGVGGHDGHEGAPLPAFLRAPLTRFNRRVSANRVVEAVALPLDSLQRARAKLDGATINDLFLGIVGGALRKYLLSKDELPSASLMALMPMSVRQAGRASPGNQVGGVPVAVHSDIADPVARVRAVQHDAQAAKRSTEALGRGFLQSLMDELPGIATEKLARYYVYPQLNVTVSNIRGPEATLYVAGARLVHFYPVSIATDYVGLNHTGFSYNGVMWISAVACRNMVPDPGFYADCLRESFAELMAAVDALPASGAEPAESPARRPGKRASGAKHEATIPARRPAAKPPRAGTTGKAKPPPTEPVAARAASPGDGASLPARRTKKGKAASSAEATEAPAPGSAGDRGRDA